MAWVKWDQITLPYESGGLNVCPLKFKNLALLAKWWWRFLSGDNVLWIRIIKSIYGIGGGLGFTSSLPENKLKKLSGRTWSNIFKIENTLTKLGCNLSNSFVKDVGNGADTRFWIDKWLGDVPLKDAFPRLFRLESFKDVPITNRLQVADSSLAFSWAWSSKPRWRTADELTSLTAAISLHKFSKNSSSSWTWKHHANGLFSTCSLVQMLNSIAAEKLCSNSQPPNPTDLNPFIPQKIGIFVWRAKLDRLPVRVALD
ncbi:uncharacterized protein [Rutidosis leptorrhynchoides]|uniref:uncharacterized protein n=1 Tax=Rutidosis leptorrhynchoides TaxID=125765 RepID=UPI003A998C2E